MSDWLDGILNGNLRRPNLSDQLFAEGKDTWMDACLDWYHDPTEFYIVGYKDAGDSLVSSVAEHEGTADSLIFPIIFVYRHYIELRLKSLLQDGCRLVDKEYEMEPNHELSKLWPRVRCILVELWPDGDKDELTAMNELIAQFERVDPRSTSFRYPKDREGNNSLKALEAVSPRVNLANLKEVVGAMSIFLEGSSLAISEFQAYKNDMQSDCW